jgi:glycosyltransferase involved in cell wall biosynthesis
MEFSQNLLLPRSHQYAISDRMAIKISIVTPNYNGERFLEQALRSVAEQRDPQVEVESIVVDGESTDGSAAILRRHAGTLAQVIREKDRGPASAINKGLRAANGDILAWLNADDRYEPGALRRAAQCLARHPHRALCFGRCRIVDEQNREIRRAITRFKEAFFPVSCRWAIQTVNYVSQPAMFFRRAAFEQAGPLREDLTAAWDYEFLLRLWRRGGAARIPGGPVAAFRWHEQSISGRQFRRQFREEYQAAAADAGRFAPQTLLHLGVRAGIVAVYAAMARQRRHARRP